MYFYTGQYQINITDPLMAVDPHSDRIQNLIEQIKQNPSAKQSAIDKTIIERACSFLHINDLDALIQNKKIDKSRINKLLRIKNDKIYEALIGFGEKESTLWDDDKIDDLIRTMKS
ncbi:hypothetical protein THOM_0313 [Trachipleistophora hominis]|uniref:Uncharacterized protein n=1 Tax=Trachipleistophora hominis TaxID=72359 RepID=L7JYQ7_TRAHO|nr:hypothetical protein THOM_0313 [Trachipleistophora hominis]